MDLHYYLQRAERMTWKCGTSRLGWELSHEASLSEEVFVPKDHLPCCTNLFMGSSAPVQFLSFQNKQDNGRKRSRGVGMSLNFTLVYWKFANWKKNFMTAYRKPSLLFRNSFLLSPFTPTNAALQLGWGMKASPTSSDLRQKHEDFTSQLALKENSQKVLNYNSGIILFENQCICGGLNNTPPYVPPTFPLKNPYLNPWHLWMLPCRGERALQMWLSEGS